MTKMKTSKSMKNMSIISIWNFLLLMNPNIFQDKLSFSLSMLTSIMFIIVLMCIKMVNKNYKNISMVNMMFCFMMMILMLSFYFSSLLMFYIFFEMSVIPIFTFLVSWGTKEKKITAGYFLFFFTFSSSLFFMVSLMYMYMMEGTFNFFIMSMNKYEMEEKFLLWCLMVVFLVKMPVFFFHIWLPLAHVESPMIGSMILASIMLKLGSYGMMRILMISFFSTKKINMYMLIWGIWGAILAAIMSLSQMDIKKMIAFSSVSHMSILISSSFSMSNYGKMGSMMMMLSHGMISSLMFLGLGLMYYRLNSKSMISLNSSTQISPSFSMWWFMILIMNLGFPPFIGFFSEFFIFVSMINVKSEFLLMGMMLIFFSSIYTINLMMYPISGLSKKNSMFSELNLHENLIMLIKMFFLTSSLMYLWMF